MTNARVIRLALLIFVVSTGIGLAADEPDPRLAEILKRFPAADADGDGKLTIQEVRAYRDQVRGGKAADQSARNVAPPPTFENVKYGPYDRNVFDLWLPDSKGPTPLLVYIHGGGFVGGNKEKIRTSPNVQRALDRGVAFASIQYRLRYPDDGDTSDPQRTGIQYILRDSARAIQFMRHRAEEYGLDKPRVACYGGSAGAGTSIWLAFHDDLADADSADPVLRESSRVVAAGMLAGQFSYDIEQWDVQFASRGGNVRATHGNRGDAEWWKFYALDEEAYRGSEGARWRADVDMWNLVTADDPPVFILTGGPDVPATSKGVYNHHPLHAQLVEERCKDCGVEVICLLPKVRPEDAERQADDPDLMMDFFFRHLGVAGE